jgi:hypothetical protein
MKKNLEKFIELLLEKGDDALSYVKYFSLTFDELVVAYEKANLSLPIYLISRKEYSLPFEGGWGNGYVKVVEGNRYYEKKYDEMDLLVHGGVTYSEYVNNTDIFPSKGFWIGFDTVHYGDTIEKWPKDKVLKETIKLFKQVYGLD